MNFSFAHFPKGTICHVNGVGLGLGKEGLTIEVKGLVQNGVDSWVIQTDLTSPISLTMAFNITYVDAIIRRGDSEDYSSMETDDPYESRDSYYENLLRRRTDKNKHNYVLGTDVLFRIIDRINCKHFIDHDKLYRYIDQSFIAGDNSIDVFGIYEAVVSKKKLTKLIKRVLPHCYVTKKQKLAEEKEMFEDSYAYGEDEIW